VNRGVVNRGVVNGGVTNTLAAEQRVWLRLRDLVLNSAAQKAQVVAELGLSFFRARALLRLLAEPLTLRTLAERLTTDPPYATLIVDDLEHQGLVSRIPHPQDGRAKLVVLTEDGRRAAERAAAILETPPAALTALCASDLAELDRIVALLVGG
jgi:DNA-binding MarR family transcriptional regulator